MIQKIYESDLSSKDSINLTDSKLNDIEVNEIFVQEVINNEFDNLEEWIDKQFNNIKKKCLDEYNHFKVGFPNENKKKETEKDESSSNYEE